MLILSLITFGFYLVPILFTWMGRRPLLLAAVALTIVVPAIWLFVSVLRDPRSVAELNWWFPLYLALAAAIGLVMARVALAVARWFGQVHPRGVVPTWIVAIVFLPAVVFYFLMGPHAGVAPAPAPASITAP
jgi:hypothetical protein